ncbi:MAG: signal recognition particle-docking protein FtsY, partial [Candidatus Microthrix parvicella]
PALSPGPESRVAPLAVHLGVGGRVPAVDLQWILLIVGVAVVAAAAGFFLVGRGPSADEPTAPGDVLTEPRPDLPDRGDTLVAVPPDEEAPPVLEALPVVEAPPLKPSFRDRLTRARSTFSGYVGSILSRSAIDAESWEELEEALIRADVGVGPATELLDSVRATVKEQGLTQPAELIEAVKNEMKSRLAGSVELKRSNSPPSIWLFVGVNGVGKTTTIGKVGRRLTDEGTSVLMAAGDTFRAAAAEQLGTWAERCGAELVRGAEGADPSSVIFDGVAKAAAQNLDVVLADTAGRLHTKSNLMDELSKVRRVADKGEGSVVEVLLVLDATTGQNGLTQARQFTQAVEVTGVVLTKLDGSAKGGIVFAIASDLGIPVKLVGLGEGADDLIEFDAGAFVDALFEE